MGGGAGGRLGEAIPTKHLYEDVVLTAGPVETAAQFSLGSKDPALHTRVADREGRERGESLVSVWPLVVILDIRCCSIIKSACRGDL